MTVRRRATGELPPRAPPGQMSNEEQPAWQGWMRQLGRQLRRMRELVGLSQEQLARLAGVSQAAVSRLEAARGLATPLLVVLKITRAIMGELRKLDSTILDADLRRAVESPEPFGPLMGMPRAETVQVTSDPQLESLVRLYRETPERYRKDLLAILAAAAAGLSSRRSGRGDQPVRG